MLAKEKGFDDEATRQLRRAFDEAGASPFRATVLRIAARFGMPMTRESEALDPGDD